MDHSRFSQIIPHLFLLRELPVQLSPIESDYCIIHLVNQALLAFSGRELPRFQAVQRAFATWSELQKENALDAARLQEAILALGPGEHLPLYLRAQNACLVLSRLPSHLLPSSTISTAAFSSHSSNSSTSQPEIETADGIVLSTFAPAIPSKQVVEAEGELLCNYPQSSIQVKRSSLLLSKAFAEQIARLHVSYRRSDRHQTEKINYSSWGEVYLKTTSTSLVLAKLASPPHYRAFFSGGVVALLRFNFSFAT